MYVCGSYAGGMRVDGMVDEEEAVVDKQSGCEKLNNYISLAVHCIGLDHKNHTSGMGGIFTVRTGTIMMQAGKILRFGMLWLVPDMRKQGRKIDLEAACIGLPELDWTG